MAHRLPHEGIEGDLDVEVEAAAKTLEAALDRLVSLIREAPGQGAGDVVLKAAEDVEAAAKTLIEAIKDLVA